MSRPVVVEYNPELDLSVKNYDKDTLISDAREFITRLPKRQARVGYLYYTIGHTMLDIAEMDNVSVKAVEKTLTAINKKLKERYA